jgi:hypothetical protein
MAFTDAEIAEQQRLKSIRDAFNPDPTGFLAPAPAPAPAPSPVAPVAPMAPVDVAPLPLGAPGAVPSQHAPLVNTGSMMGVQQPNSVVPQAGVAADVPLAPIKLLKPTPMAPPQDSMGLQPKTLTSTDSTTQTQTSTTSGKDTRGLQAANKQLGDVTRVGGELEGKQQLAKGEAGLEIAAQKAQDLEDLQAQDALRKATLEAEKQKVDQAVNEQANFQFDANRFYKRMSTGQSVAAGVGIALGALAQGFGQKSNAALDILDKQVDKDLQQQQMEYSKLKDKTAAANSGYGMMRQMGLDDKEASLKFKEMAVNNLQSKLEAGLTKQFGPEVAAQKASEAVANQRAKLEEQKVVAQGQTTKSVSNITKTETKANPLAMGMRGGYRDGDGKILSGEVAGKVAFHDQTLNELNSMKKILAEDKSTWSPTGTGKYARSVERAIDTLGRLRSGGAIGDNEFKSFKNMLTNRFDTKEEGLARIDEMMNSLMVGRNALTVSPYSAPEDTSVPVIGKKY